MSRNSKISIIFAVSILLAVGLACGGSSTPSDEKQAGPEFVGVWTAKDGSFITIRADGGGDYKIGSTSVSGGSAKVSEKDKTLRIALLGMGSPMKIDKAPANGEMTIDGIVYKKDGGGSSSSSSNSSSSSSEPTGDLPSTDEANKLVKESLTAFISGTDDGKFTDFYALTSEEWKETYSQQQTDDLFKVFHEKADKIRPSLEDAASKTPELSSGPKFVTDSGYTLLVINGDYPSKPYRLTFETQYLKQDGKWKIKKFKIDL